MGGDVYFCGDSSFEGMFVEGVEKAAEFVPVTPDFVAGHYVDYQGEGEGDPGDLLALESGVGRRWGKVPDDAVKGCDAKEIPASINPTPELLVYQ